MGGCLGSPAISKYQLSRQTNYTNEMIVNTIDKRYKIDHQKVKQFPHYCIGLLISVSRLGQISKGTGWLISKNLILTSAHLFYYLDSEGIFIKFQPFSFYPGLDDNIGKQLIIQDYKVNEDYDSNYKKYGQNCQTSRQNDYALLKLKKPVQHLDKCISLKINKQEKSNIFICGYPSEKIGKTQMKQYTANQYGHSQISANNDKGMIYYQIDTSPGQSGSPILLNKQKNVAIGIHKAGCKKPKNHNFGVLFNKDILAELKKWQQEMNGEPIDFIEEDKPEYKFEWDASTPYSQYFQINGTQAQLMKDDDLYQLTSSQPISNTVKVKLIKYGDKSICIGILSAKRKKQQFSGGSIAGQEQSIGFWISNKNQKGSIIMDGEVQVSSQSDLFVKEGQIIMIEIYRTQNSIIFTIPSQSNKKITLVLSSKFKDKQLFVYAVMQNKGDRISIE